MNDDISESMKDRALAELAYEVPEKAVLLEKLGKFAYEVENFIERLQSISFLSRIGEPIQQYKAEKVEWVKSWEEALEKAKPAESREKFDKYYDKLKQSITEHNRGDLSDAAFYLYNEYTSLTLPKRIRGAVVFDIEGALDEIIMQDISNHRLFLELFVWYERGHWPCAVKNDGTVIVF